MRAAMLMLAAGLLLAACESMPQAAPTESPGAVPLPTRDPAAMARAEATDGPFRLVLELAGDTWQAGEPIDGHARLELLEGPAVDLFGSGGGVLGFEVREVDGRREMGGAWTADCVAHRLAPGAPLQSGLAKSGGYSGDDPEAAFYRAFYADPLFRLPAGRWEVTAVVSAALDDCGGRPVALRAPITITVAP